MDETIRQAERNSAPSSKLLQCRVGNHEWLTKDYFKGWHKDNKRFQVYIRLCAVCSQLDFPVTVEDYIPGQGYLMPTAPFTSISSNSSFPIATMPSTIVPSLCMETSGADYCILHRGHMGLHQSQHSTNWSSAF